MNDVRTPKVNKHVLRLNRFLPFSPAHDQIFEEYQTDEDSLDLETRAIDYAKRAIEAGAQLIVLTGDAGHGKTHMCRRLLMEHLHLDAKEARKQLLKNCAANEVIKSADGIRTGLRIHKDLSEVHPPQLAAKLLEESSDSPEQTLIVCANEGRLRAIVSSPGAGTICQSISRLFQDSFKRGVTASDDGLVHIINLNFQSVAADGASHDGGLLRRTLKEWVGNGQRWSRSCGSCSVQTNCPINRNRAMLAGIADDDDSRPSALDRTRAHRLEELFEVIERLGHVVTIREMLMLVAYLITGGLSCNDVASKVMSTNVPDGWQHAWTYYNLLFKAPPDLSEDRVYKGIPTLTYFKRIDPGQIASRRVDERILHEGDLFKAEQLDLMFAVQRPGGVAVVDAAGGIDEFIGAPQSKAEQQREAEMTGVAVAALRRRVFFDDEGAEGTVMARLGFRYGDDFLAMLGGRLQRPDQVRLKNIFIAGLHAIQGLRLSGTEPALKLVDPAFGRARADAAIIAGSIPGSHISLIPARQVWQSNEGPWTLPQSVDWIDRTVALQVDERLGHLHYLHLDLLAFECIARAASGYVSEDFYGNEIRRVRTFLGSMAERCRTGDGQISVYMRGRIQSVSIDMGVIQVGGQ